MPVSHFEPSHQESVHMQSWISLVSTAKHPQQSRKTEENKESKTEARRDVFNCFNVFEIRCLTCFASAYTGNTNVKAVQFVEKGHISSSLAKVLEQLP